MLFAYTLAVGGAVGVLYWVVSLTVCLCINKLVVWERSSIEWALLFKSDIPT